MMLANRLAARLAAANAATANAATAVAAHRAQRQPSRGVLFVPHVVENTSRGERTYDIFSRLLRERIVCLFGEIDDTVASLAVAQLLFLENQSSGKPISMYINSPGGVVSSGMGIYDTMQFIHSPVHTTCIGQASSMGSLLLTAGAAGHRFALPNARIMVHQPSGGAFGMASDIDIKAREILRLRARLNDIYSKHTGRDIKTIEKSLDRDTFFSPEEAVEFGLIDKVISRAASA